MIHLYLVGGAVRDILLGRPSKDFDFAVEAASYDEMKEWLFENNFEIFLETPQYFTIRARRNQPWVFGGIDVSGLTFDFVLCRKEGSYIDGRRPDHVEPGTIFDDLERRDFTMNAIAIQEDGVILDPHDGTRDIQSRVIRCVGKAEDRLEEDALRIFRAIRFAVTLSFKTDDDILDYIEGNLNFELLNKTSEERIREELFRAFSYSTLNTLDELERYSELREWVFTETSLWLMPTMKGR